MQIAIITPARNVAPYIAEAINSVLAQTHSDWSQIIIDDGSSDATAAIAAGYTDPRIHLIRLHRAGASAARNAGIQAAPPGTKALLFLDADDWLAPTALHDLAATLANAPWAVAACARYARVHFDGARTLSANPPDGVVFDRLLTRNLFVNGGHLLVAADAVAQAGAFRTDLYYGEDWEYWCRLAMLGEFAAVRTAAPLLFLRERKGSACYGLAASRHAYLQALDAILTNPAIISRIGHTHLARFRRRAEAEIAWAVGRELIRHGSGRDGRRWLLTALAGAPSLKRACMLPLSLAGAGPFRPYHLGA